MNDHLAQLRSLIAGTALRPREAQLLALVQPAVRLKKRMSTREERGPRRWFGLAKGESTFHRVAAPISPGRSKLGGIPDVPPGFRWPHTAGAPLGFIGQIRCTDLPRANLGRAWPDQGILYFFYDLEEQPWGGEGTDPVAPSVFYSELNDPLQPAQVPGGRNREKLVLPVFGVDMELVPTLPDFEAPEVENLGLTAAEADAYIDLRTSLGDLAHGAEPAHQMGGHANNVQGDVRVEFELYSGDGPDLRRPEDWVAAAVRADDWQLLLQVDTDDDLKVMWGDAGMLYFGIRTEDLASRRFERAHVMMQCS